MTFCTHMFVGQFNDIAVRITVDRDVIFDIDLPARLEDPVRLYLLYSDVDSGEVDEVITSAIYTNLTNIYHIVFDSEVRYDRFQVTVALISEPFEGARVRGPLRNAGEYGEF